MERYRYFDVDAPDYQPMEYFSSDEADPAAYLAGLQGTYVADDKEAIFEDLAAEDEILETIATQPEEEPEATPQVEAELETMSASDAPADEVISEEEPPESSAV